MALPRITIVEGSKVQISAVDTVMTGKISQKTIDMAPFAGQVVRVWVDEDGSFSTNPGGKHIWQVAELTIPEIAYQPQMVEDPEGSGEMVEQSVAVPLDLNSTPVTLWPLPV